MSRLLTNSKERGGTKKELNQLSKDEVIEVIMEYCHVLDKQATSDMNASPTKYMVNEFGGVKRCVLNLFKVLISHKVSTKDSFKIDKTYSQWVKESKI